MAAFTFLDPEVVLAIHEQQLAAHGGSPGLRDRGLLDSALARPANRVAYESRADIVAVATAYAFGIVRNHPFVDGNKRTGFVAMELCLLLNGHTLEASDEDCVMAMLQLASGDTEEDQFAAWVRKHLGHI